MTMCPLCEKRFQDRRGLHGHFRFVHGIEYGSGKPAKKTALTEATREMIERRKGERELIDRIKRGEFELIPKSTIGRVEKKKSPVFRGFDAHKEGIDQIPRSEIGWKSKKKEDNRFEGLRKALERWR